MREREREREEKRQGEGGTRPYVVEENSKKIDSNFKLVSRRASKQASKQASERERGR